MSRTIIPIILGCFMTFITLSISPESFGLSIVQSPTISSNYHVSYNFNQTTIDRCDFLNLCNSANMVNLNDVSQSFNKGIVDISYLKIDVDLPFP